MRAVTDILQGAPPPPAAATPAELLPPRLRGWLHLVCFVVSVPAGALVIASAGTARGRVAGAVYAFGMTAMFGVSALYHRRRWSPAARRRMRRTDHGTIFLMIAGSYTPLCLLALRGTAATAFLTAVWIGAGMGFFLALTGIAEKDVIGLLCYIGLGWAMVLALPQLSRHLSGVRSGSCSPEGSSTPWAASCSAPSGPIPPPPTSATTRSGTAWWPWPACATTSRS